MKKNGLLVGLSVVVVLAAASCGGAGSLMREPEAEFAVPDLGDLAAGQVHWGEKRYVEYIVGDLPLILSVPHGGTLTPSEIPDRTRGYSIGDSGTQELTRLVAEAFTERTGHTPHVVISRLARSKLDPNREPEEAANGNPIAERAWLEYHGFIDAAKRHVATSSGPGLYVDIHGHGHRVPWVELGYLVRPKELNGPDKTLDRWPFNRRTSLRALVKATSTPLSQLVRGPTSLGALLERRGYRTVPSPGDPGPKGAAYFNGGYSTLRHGSFHSGSISSIQLESPKRRVRDTLENRRAFARHLAEALVEFMETHYGLALARTAAFESDSL